MSGVFRSLHDSLDDAVRRFEQAEPPWPLFINSIPKSGTHLLLNILRMFTPPERHYHYNFIQLAFLRDHPEVFLAQKRYLSAGHLLFADLSVRALRGVRHIVLIRDPYDVVLARARHYVSDRYHSTALAHLKTGEIPTADLLSLMILGIHQKLPSLREVYLHNAVGWTASDATFVKYEDIVAAVADLASETAESFFQSLFADCGIKPMPGDWRERIRIGADPGRSRTARRNLSLPTPITIPEMLPDPHRRLVDHTMPGVRSLLGYA